jgi:hypothetical protein
MNIRQMTMSAMGAALVAIGFVGVAVAADKGITSARELTPTTASNESCLVRGATTVYNGCGLSVILAGIIPRIELSAQTYDTIFGLTANDSSRARFTGYRADGGWIWTSGWKDSNETYDRNLNYQTTGSWDTYVPAGGSMYLEINLQKQGTFHWAGISR